MHIVMTADLHGTLPGITPCDLLIIAGDICPIKGSHSPAAQAAWLRKAFAPWLESIEAKHIIGVAGNHDFIFEHPKEVPELPWTYLEDTSVTVEGLNIHGTPWVPNLKRWAFHGGMGNRCKTKFNDIPEDTDILVSHGPFSGHGDFLEGYGHIGCTKMREKIHEVQPSLFVCGHIHEGYGHYRDSDIKHGVYNVAHMDEFYEPVNSPVELILPAS